MSPAQRTPSPFHLFRRVSVLKQWRDTGCCITGTVMVIPAQCRLSTLRATQAPLALPAPAPACRPLSFCSPGPLHDLPSSARPPPLRPCPPSPPWSSEAERRAVVDPGSPGWTRLGVEHTLTRVASRRGPQPWGSQPLGCPPFPTSSPRHMWPRSWGEGLQPQEPLSAQPPVHVYSSQPGPLPAGEGSWERGHGCPTRKPLSLGTMMSLTGWEGPGVGSWKEAGTLQGLEPWPSSIRVS